MKSLRVGTFFNNHKLKEFDRFNKPETPLLKTTSENYYNSWNICKYPQQWVGRGGPVT